MRIIAPLLILFSLTMMAAAEKPYVCTPAQAEAGECLPIIKQPPPPKK